MLSISHLFSALQSHSLSESISFTDIDKFMRFTRHLKPELSVGLTDASIPCHFLPKHVVIFLSRALALHPEVIQHLWQILGTTIWQLEHSEVRDDERKMFNKYSSEMDKGHEKLAYFMFYPPLSSWCGKVLTHLSRVPVTYFSKQGAFSAFSSSLCCVNETCQIRYYHNYFVWLQESRQQYYGHQSLPLVLHVEEHSFVETTLSELFAAWTLFAWVSTSNCAAIYNHVLSGHSEDVLSDSKFTLTSRTVWRAFVLNSLLRDWSERSQTLVMSETGELDVRLKVLMCQWNNRMITEGQPERLRACRLCEKFVATDLPGAWRGLHQVSSSSSHRWCCYWPPLLQGA